MASAARRRPGVAPQKSSEKSNWYTAIKMVVEVMSSAIDNGHAGKPPMKARALTKNSSVAHVSTRLSTKIEKLRCENENIPHEIAGGCISAGGKTIGGRTTVDIAR